MVPGSKAGFEMWIYDFQCAFNDFSHCKFPDCSLLHWQVDAIIGFCNIRHFMEATEVRNSELLSQKLHVEDFIDGESHV